MNSHKKCNLFQMICKFCNWDHIFCKLYLKLRIRLHHIILHNFNFLSKSLVCNSNIFLVILSHKSSTEIYKSYCSHNNLCYSLNNNNLCIPHPYYNFLSNSYKYSHKNCILANITSTLYLYLQNSHSDIFLGTLN